MRHVAVSFLLIFLLMGCCDCPPQFPTVEIPRGSKDPNQPRINIMVSVGAGPRWKIGDTLIANSQFDSILQAKIHKAKILVDTPTVVINADSTALYGDVWRVMRVAKRDSAKVVANVQ
jgi:biopolymer transport protein ExbD